MGNSRRYAFSVDLSEPTAVTYVNGIVARTPRAWAWMMVRLPPMLFLVRAQDGCLQAKSFLGGPREMLMLSYWRDEEALRGLYTHPRHVALMRTVFRHPDWFTLFNETYRIPISTRYWNAPNGYALSQPWQAATLQELADTGLLHPAAAEELSARR
jgi:hypothetical protein